VSWILATPLFQKALKWGLLLLGAILILAYARRSGEAMGRKAEKLQQLVNNAQKTEVANEVRRDVARKSGAADRLRDSRWTRD
jgi:hypothetical protein